MFLSLRWHQITAGGPKMRTCAGHAVSSILTNNAMFPKTFLEEAAVIAHCSSNEEKGGEIIKCFLALRRGKGQRRSDSV